MILLLLLGGLLVWPMIAWLMEKVKSGESLLVPVAYLTIYTELLLVYWLVMMQK